MRVYFFLPAILLLSALSGCSTDEEVPSVQQMYLTESPVSAGSTVDVFVDFRVPGTDYESDPFFAVLNFPLGARYVAGSSMLERKTPRPPDGMGTCPDGRTYLVYEFKQAEFSDPYFADSFVGTIKLSVTLELAADKAKMRALAALTPPADPCVLLGGDELEFRVK